MSAPFDPTEDAARDLDAADPLAAVREKFHVPADEDGRPRAYLCGNSLGLAPRAARGAVERELDDWARLGVDGHFSAASPWFAYHERLRGPLARLAGARPDEVVAMNSLTVNLHLMLVSFFRPEPARHRVLLEAPAFPSDRYAVASHLALHGYDPRDALVESEEVETVLEREGERIALVLLGAVNYFTGRLYDTRRVVAAARSRGAVVGLDLAHAIGNVPLSLHDDGPDFAVWCSYKYLNGGPGAVGGCFVHERHHGDATRDRLAGWWGNDPRTRFRMQTERAFVPVAGADGWQLSNPSILAMTPLVAACAVFDEIGMGALRAKSERLTGYAERFLDHAARGKIDILTPRDPGARGCQLSLRPRGDARDLEARLRRAGIVCDYREPDVIRIAPVPSYNTFHDVWRVGRTVEAWTAETR